MLLSLSHSLTRSQLERPSDVNTGDHFTAGIVASTEHGEGLRLAGGHGFIDRLENFLPILAGEGDGGIGFFHKLRSLLQYKHRNVAAGHAGQVGHDAG